jgi:hypothetical protein
MVTERNSRMGKASTKKVPGTVAAEVLSEAALFTSTYGSVIASAKW